MHESAILLASETDTVSRIRILPEILSNKIAAGEVVERPASVVKELVENALDAKANRIIIEVENGGRALIRVSDNGTGMNRDDALLSIERHATSKIYSDADLFSIRSLGFRGEALPSIASVSKFMLETRESSSDVGTRIDIEGGKIKSVSDIGSPLGTQVTVKNLFFNTPARQKFMKSVNTEIAHIADTVTNLALGWHDVYFRLDHNGKTVMTSTAASNIFDRVLDVLGTNLKNDLFPVSLSDNYMSLSGYIASPRMTRSSSKSIHVFINKRIVKDRIVLHALHEAYSGRLMKGQFPVAVLLIDLSPERVDVNVHPSKHEVRFLDHSMIYNRIVHAVSETLKKIDRPEWIQPDPKPASQEPKVSESVLKFDEPVFISPPLPVEKIRQPIELPRQPALVQQIHLWEKKPFESFRVIGQFKGTYIICESDQGLMLIDQHAAHERIFFERLKSEKNISVQRLLIPETIELRHSEAQLLEQVISDFKQIGIEIEPFGGTTFVVKAVPTLIANQEVKPLILEILEKVIDTGIKSGWHAIMDDCLKLIACHGAIRANQKLTAEEIQSLLVELGKCDQPANCPHGRPVWIQWQTSFIEKAFRRIA